MPPAAAVAMGVAAAAAKLVHVYVASLTTYDK